MILAIDLHSAGLAAFVEEKAGITAARRTVRIVKTDGLPPATQIPGLLHQAFEGTRHASWLESAAHRTDAVIVCLPNSAAYRADVYRVLVGMGFSAGKPRFCSRAQMIARGIAAQHPMLVQNPAGSETGKGFAVVQPTYFSNDHAAEISVFEFSDGTIHQLGTKHMPASKEPSKIHAALDAEAWKFESFPVSRIFYASGLDQELLSLICEHCDCPAIECLASPDDTLPGLAHQTALLGGASGYNMLSLNCLGFSVWVDNARDLHATINRDDTIPTQGTFAAPPPSKLENGKLIVSVRDREGLYERLYIPFSGNETPLTLVAYASGMLVLRGDGIPGGSYDILWNLNT